MIKVGDKVGFQFGSIWCEGKVTKILTPGRVEVLVRDGTETTNQTYEIDIVNLIKED